MIYKIINVWKNVFGNVNYIIITVLFGLAFYFLNAIIVQWKNINSLGLKFIGALIFNGVYSSVTAITFVNLIIISFLTGFLISLLIFRFKNKIKYMTTKNGFFGYIGMFLGIFVPGCASCGIGIVAVLGLSSSLLSLPFKGAEIGFISIILLLYSIISVSKNIALGETCPIRTV